MAENLVIVESPAKAKTIEKILGKDYLVTSSFGHIRDLPKKGLGIEIDRNFKPEYEISEDKKSVVTQLKKLTKGAKKVWLASDEDREGEAIAWHLAQVLGLDERSDNRIVFHEITSSAIKHAIQHPRSIDRNLVDAQQARRVLDRLVGFELSPLLWKKVKPSLSAGRVQSVAVRLIVEREREIIAFSAAAYYRVTAEFTVRIDGKEERFKTELSDRFATKEQARGFLEKCAGAAFKVSAVEKKPARRSPAAPFTTSTLQQEASRRLGFSVSQTMRIAQRLYESGLITYMRTDSVNLSKEAVGAISQVIRSDYGEQYLHNRNYTTKSKGAQEAHEAIRPTYVANRKIEGSDQEKKLYALIWRRSVASQMADAQLERTTIQIPTPEQELFFIGKGEVITFDGFLALYDGGKEDSFLPAVRVGDPLDVEEMEATERFEQRPARYSEASLVRQLEELGIGRPSTYAPTITTIINRGYVVKEDREGVKREYTRLLLSPGGQVEESRGSEVTGAERSKLFPTDIGMIVNDYLQKHFPDILDYNFTASVEEQFDDIAQGSLEWQKMLTLFYGDFHRSVSKAGEEGGGYATSEHRLLGVDPATGKNVYARMGRFGAMVQLGDTEGEQKPQYAGLKAHQLIETVTLEEALELFRLPRNVGEYEGKSVTIGLGRFGPYIRHDNKFVSIPAAYSPYTINLEESIALIEDKRKKERERVLRVYDEDPSLQILNGRWGPYIFYNDANYKAPKEVRERLKDMSYDEVMAIVKQEGSISKRSVRRTAGKTAAKTTTVRKSAASKTTATVRKTAGTAKKSSGTAVKKSVGKTAKKA